MWLIICVHSPIPQNSRKKYFCWLNIQKIFIIFFNLHTSILKTIQIIKNQNVWKWRFLPVAVHAPWKIVGITFSIKFGLRFLALLQQLYGILFFCCWVTQKKRAFSSEFTPFYGPCNLQSQSMDLLYKKISEMGEGNK